MRTVEGDWGVGNSVMRSYRAVLAAIRLSIWKNKVRSCTFAESVSRTAEGDAVLRVTSISWLWKLSKEEGKTM